MNVENLADCIGIMNTDQETVERKSKKPSTEIEELPQSPQEDTQSDAFCQTSTSNKVSLKSTKEELLIDVSASCEKDDPLGDVSLTHEELLKVTSSTLNELLKNDPIMHDLPPDVTVDEVEALIAVLHGQAITVFVKRGENDDIPVIVKQKDSKVSDLKRAFKRALTLKLRRDGERYKISWKHVWRVYWLSCDGCKLDNDHGLLKDYGVVNKSKVSFVPKVKEKKQKLKKRY